MHPENHLALFSVPGSLHAFDSRDGESTNQLQQLRWRCDASDIEQPEIFVQLLKIS